MRNPVIPLRLSPEVPVEAQIRELYEALPKERRMAFIRHLLELGLAVHNARAAGEASVVLSTAKRPDALAGQAPVTLDNPASSPAAPRASVAPTPVSVSKSEGGKVSAKGALGGMFSDTSATPVPAQ